MANVLLVDTNFSSGPQLQWLRQQGHQVYVVGGRPHEFLAKHDPNYIQLDYSHVDLLLALCKRLKIDHVVPGCNDRSYLACAELAQHRASTGIDTLANARLLHDKVMFRHWAQAQGLSVPKPAAVETLQQQGVPLAVIVKPADSFSGKGISLVQAGDTAGLNTALALARQISPTGRCMAEEYVQGQLYSHSAFLQQQRIVHDVLVAEYGSANPFVVDTSHVVDTQGPTPHATLLVQVRAQIEHIATQLQLADGLIHTQLIARNGSSDAGFALIEITRRCPGDLYSQLVELSTGFAYAANYARGFLGLPPDLLQTALVPVMRHTVTLPQAGVLSHLRFHEPVSLARWVPLSASGDAISPSPLGRIAILFAQCETQQQLHALTQATCARRLYTFNG